MALSRPQKTEIRQASRIAIQNEISSISHNWISGNWLKDNNRYTKDPRKKIHDDIRRNKRHIHAHMRQYIAASSVLHCIDGWGYLGRSIEAGLKGDSDVSRHLGYYAELRAAMSILATEGIGIFGNFNFVVKQNRLCEQVNGSGTHIFTWDVLEYWASTNMATDLLFKIIKPGGIPLSEWLDQFSMGSGFRSIIAKQWLFQWGIDIKRLALDRDARNIASYNPTSLASSRALSIDNTLQMVNEFWNAYEPLEFFRFHKSDRFLLKNSLEQYFKSLHPNRRSHRQARRIYERQIRNMLHGLSPGDLTSEDWANYLINDRPKNSMTILDEAKGEAGPTNSNHHKHVIARAALLLRLATGSCEEHIKTVPGFDRDHLRFWWTTVGEDRCLWHDGKDPDEFTDLWADIRDAIEDISSWLQSPPSRETSYYNMWKEIPSAAGLLGSTERIGLWGLGL